MLLETLGRLRSRATPSPGASQEQISQDEDGIRNSVRSTGTATSSVTSSPGRSTKRYSNNLFGSGRLRDYTYLKSVTSSKGSGASMRTVSLTPTENSARELSNTNLRPVTPDGNTPSSSVQSSPNEKGSMHSAPFVPPTPFSDSAIQAISAAESRLQKTLGPSVLKRASMAIEQAIKEIEDEVDDEILLPRSVPVPRGSLDLPPSDAVRSSFFTIFSLPHFLLSSRETVMSPATRPFMKLAWPFPLTRPSMTSSVNGALLPFQRGLCLVMCQGCLGL